MASLNPEFERNLWLEFTKHRLIAMPALIVMIFLIMHNLGLRDFVLATTAMVFFLLLTMLWGGYKAAGAVLEEINDNTWDFQRLSSLSPLSLALGKLFGSTCYIWYGGLMLLWVYVWLSDDGATPEETVYANSLLLLLGTLICHATALLSSLQAARYASVSRTKMHIINHHVLGVVAGVYFTAAISKDFTRDNETLWWYGIVFPSLEFMTALAFLVFLWLLLGIYWQMRAQLKMHTTPVPWAAFVFFVMVLIGGFRWEYISEYAVNLGFYVAFMSGMLLYYLMLILEVWNGLTYRQLYNAWIKNQRQLVIELFPRWLLTLMLALPMGVLFILIHGTDEMFSTIACSVLAFTCFSLRDAAIFHYFRLSPNSRYPQSTAILYLCVLYGLIPWLFFSVGLPQIAHLFFPFPGFSSTISAMLASTVSGMAQAGVVWTLAWDQWKRYWQSTLSAKDMPTAEAEE